MEYAESMSDVLAILAFAVLPFGVPILISRLILRASWRVIAHAYAIWFGFLLVVSTMSGNYRGEGIGWAMILGMFLSSWVVPVIIIILKLASFFLKLTRRARTP